MKIKEIKINDKLYPNKLKNIINPPDILYCIGDTALLNTFCIASVGSRRCTNYGKRVALFLGEKAAEYNVTLVSGMAYGIDYYSHLGALENGGKTIAVLGCGVDICYPKRNYDVYERIANNGLLISEVEPGKEPKPYYFPLRNRIISALSNSVIICEAEISSGSMITAELAIEQGKSVYSVPGDIFSLNSYGTNKLILDGAKIVTTLDDVFIDMNLKKDVKLVLSKSERIIYQIVKEKGEVEIKEIAKLLNMNDQDVKRFVGNLVLKGCVFYEVGKVFIAN